MPYQRTFDDVFCFCALAGNVLPPLQPSAAACRVVRKAYKSFAFVADSRRAVSSEYIYVENF
jgi:hypothetical protein